MTTEIVMIVKFNKSEIPNLASIMAQINTRLAEFARPSKLGNKICDTDFLAAPIWIGDENVGSINIDLRDWRGHRVLAKPTELTATPCPRPIISPESK